MARDERAYLEARIERSPGCWIWTGPRTARQYGVATYGGRTTTAQRAVYLEFAGPISEGLHLDHLCRNPPCVNPAHMEPVTPAENKRRGMPYWEYKTYCPRGHEYTEENAYRDRNDRWVCRLCDRARPSRRTPRPRPQRTHCKHGHEFTPENTQVGPDGRRHCRACGREHAAAWRAANPSVPAPPRNECRKGHDLDEQNTYWFQSADGPKRLCLICKRARDRAGQQRRRAKRAKSS